MSPIERIEAHLSRVRAGEFDPRQLDLPGLWPVRGVR